jgi:death-on-curing protein
VSDTPYLYLTVSQIRELHDAVLEEFGGAGGSRSFASLDSCAEAPQNVAYLQEGDIFEQASAYACSILRKKPFKDGNRRMALVTALVFLEINGLTDHNYDAAMLFQAVLYLAEGQMDGDLFAQFLRDAVSGVTGTWVDESRDR